MSYAHEAVYHNHELTRRSVLDLVDILYSVFGQRY